MSYDTVLIHPGAETHSEKAADGFELLLQKGHVCKYV